MTFETFKTIDLFGKLKFGFKNKFLFCFVCFAINLTNFVCDRCPNGCFQAGFQPVIREKGIENWLKNHFEWLYVKTFLICFTDFKL